MDLILKYFPGLSEIQKTRFEKLEPFYRYWNQQINLVSRKDLENLYERHILHSLAIARVLKIQPYQTVLDVGTGGGFPGIPLAIFFPETKFHLVDSIGKKINVVSTLIREINLDNVCAEQIRVENLKQQYDIIVSRAVTSLPEFVKLAKGKIYKSKENSVNGIYYLKGGNIAQEINIFKEAKVYNLASIFNEPYFETKLLIFIPSRYL